MSAALALRLTDLGELRRAIDRASDKQPSAVTVADVLETRACVHFAYDAAKAAARLVRGRGAHDEVLSIVFRAQADALEAEEAR